MEALFLRILNMSFCAADVIGVVLLLWLALWRAPKKWRYLLWAVVAFRLVCPVSFSAPFSILRYAVQPAAVTQRTERSVSEITYIPQNIAEMAEPKVYVSASPAVSEAVSQSLPRPLPWDSANPLQIYIPICAGLWCLGMAAMLLYGMISYVNLRRRLRGAVRAEPGLYETDAVRAPFILGLVRPKVFLPVGLTGEPLHYVLAHERFHIRRGDHAVKLLAFLLLCVHWFNPLVWLAYALMSRDMEMRCDEAVLSAERGITKKYSMALLSFASARRFPSPSPLCFGETGVKARIQNVLRWKKPKAWVTVCAALLCVIAVAACAANPSRKETKQGTPWDWTSTVQLSGIKGFAEGRGLTLSHTQMKQLVALLNAVQPDEVVRGRGIPSNQTLDITTGVGYRLRWAAGIIELDFDDAAAAAELYGGPETLGPGVWEIHNEALYDFLDGLTVPTPASASDLMPENVSKYNVMEEQPAPKSWRQTYLDFFTDTILPAQAEAHPGRPIYGVALMDIDFDTVPELMVWDLVASAASTGMLYRIDGAKVVPASEGVISTEILYGRVSELEIPMEKIRAFWLVQDRMNGNVFWAVHSGNGLDDRSWGAYLVFDGNNTEVASYDSEKKEDRTAAWNTFNSRYEVMDVDYSDFTLSVYTDGEIDEASFRALLKRWKPVIPKQ